MGQGSYTVADIENMLKHCAPDAKVYRRGHHYRAMRGSLRYTTLPKGKGSTGQPMHKVTVENGHIRSLARALNVPFECVEKYLPGFRS